jgi:hypothetical protein
MIAGRPVQEQAIVVAGARDQADHNGEGQGPTEID